MPDATVVVSDVTTKEGTGKTGKPWKLYALIDGNQDRYVTFSGEVGRAAEALKGKRANISFEITEKGNDLKSITEAAPEKPAGGSRYDDPVTQRRITLLACLKVAAELVGDGQGLDGISGRTAEAKKLAAYLADWVESAASQDSEPPF